ELPPVGQLRGGREVSCADGEIVIVGEDHSATARGDRLVPVEADDAEKPEGSGVLAPDTAAERFGRVLDDGDTVRVCDRDDLLDRRWVAQRVHRDDPADPA